MNKKTKLLALFFLFLIAAHVNNKIIEKKEEKIIKDSENLSAIFIQSPNFLTDRKWDKAMEEADKNWHINEALEELEKEDKISK